MRKERELTLGPAELGALVAAEHRGADECRARRAPTARSCTSLLGVALALGVGCSASRTLPIADDPETPVPAGKVDHTSPEASSKGTSSPSCAWTDEALVDDWRGESVDDDRRDVQTVSALDLALDDEGLAHVIYAVIYGQPDTGPPYRGEVHYLRELAGGSWQRVRLADRHAEAVAVAAIAPGVARLAFVTERGLEVRQLPSLARERRLAPGSTCPCEVTVDRQGAVHVAHLVRNEDAGTYELLYGRLADGGSWSSERIWGDHRAGWYTDVALAIDAAGAAHVLHVRPPRHESEQLYVTHATNASGVWQPEVVSQLPVPEWGDRSYALAVDERLIHVVGVVHGDPSGYVVKTDRWLEPVELAPHVAVATMTLDRAGRPVVVSHRQPPFDNPPTLLQWQADDGSWQRHPLAVDPQRGHPVGSAVVVDAKGSPHLLLAARGRGPVLLRWSCSLAVLAD